MTFDELCDRVEFWRSKIDHMGIGHWDLTIRKVSEIEHNEDAWASCHPHELYDSAVLEFVLDEIPDHQIDRVIVHELLHIPFRDLWGAAEATTHELGPAAGMLLRQQLKRELEGLVDRMARTIVFDLVRVQDEPGTLPT